jgi:hypothetical protein
MFYRQAHCPFNGPSYQLMRNFLWAAAYAQREHKQRFGVLLICPNHFYAQLEEQVEAFRNQVRRPQYHGAVQLRTYEDYATLLQVTGEVEAHDLATFLQNRIHAFVP